MACARTEMRQALPNPSCGEARERYAKRRHTISVFLCRERHRARERARLRTRDGLDRDTTTSSLQGECARKRHISPRYVVFINIFSIVLSLLLYHIKSLLLSSLLLLLLLLLRKRRDTFSAARGPWCSGRPPQPPGGALSADIASAIRRCHGQFLRVSSPQREGRPRTQEVRFQCRRCNLQLSRNAAVCYLQPSLSGGNVQR